MGLGQSRQYWWDMETRYPLVFQPRHNLSFRVILPVPGRKASIHVQQYNWWIYSWCGWYFVKTCPISKWFNVFSMLLTSKCTGRYDWHKYFPDVMVDDSESVAKLLPKSAMDTYARFYITLHLEVSCHCISASLLLVHNQSASSMSHTVNPRLLSMMISVIQPMARANGSPSHALPSKSSTTPTYFKRSLWNVSLQITIQGDAQTTAQLTTMIPLACHLHEVCGPRGQYKCWTKYAGLQHRSIRQTQAREPFINFYLNFYLYWCESFYSMLNSTCLDS